MMTLTGGKCRLSTTERSQEQNLDAAVEPNDFAAENKIIRETEIIELYLNWGLAIANWAMPK